MANLNMNTKLKCNFLLKFKSLSKLCPYGNPSWWNSGSRLWKGRINICLE